jgi:hypothetical protein
MTRTLISKPKDESNYQTRLIGAGSYILLFLFMAFPMAYDLLYLKAFLFGGLLVAIFVEYITTGRSQLDNVIGLWSLALAVISFFFVMEGFFAGTPGARAAALVYVVWPVAYVVWIAGVANARTLLGIHYTAIIATLFIGLYGCMFLLTQIHVIPEFKIISALSFGWEDESFGAHEGFTGMQFAGLNSLPFLLPYVMASLAIQFPPKAGKRSIRQTFTWAACILGWIVTLAASRRALLLVISLTPLLILALRSFQPKIEKLTNKRSMLSFSLLFIGGIILLFIGLSSIYSFNLSSMWDRFASGFDLGSQTLDEGSALRNEQFYALMRGWMEHPILGAGHGASAFGSIRSQNMPWAYELSYLALLFQTGLVGFVAYTAGVGWILHQGLKMIREGGHLGRMMIPVMVGCCSMLIVNGTNPYLSRFDGMWMLFLPLMVINYRRSVGGGDSEHAPKRL